MFKTLTDERRKRKLPNEETTSWFLVPAALRAFLGIDVEHVREGLGSFKESRIPSPQ